MRGVTDGWRTARAAALVGATLALAGCAGFRGGWESVPWVGAPPDPPPAATTAFEAERRSELRLPCLTLGVRVSNRVRTYDTQVWFFVLPFSVDPRTVRTHDAAPGTTRVTLRVADTAGDFVFRPERARLLVQGKPVPASAGFVFGMWDAAGNRIDRGGKWADRPVAGELALSEAARTHSLTLEFPASVPAPQDADLALDLSEALVAPGRSIPTIRFLPVRWREGYT